MFSSVFDKIVSPTAPDALGTFPPRGDLPASSSTLCCLSFADNFISHYPTVPTASINDDADGHLLIGRAAIAMSADDLEAIMQSAAELGGRLAAALAGTVRSKRRELATAPVSDLLGKVRGIFGNRLTSVGREIRVTRNAEAERDETLLLRQIHALKNAALSACEGEKWCLIVSCGGESLAVCSVPLPAVEEGGACGCDFLVFDPWPRPAMKLRGSYIVKFTTVRGLQLHLLSALGEIWRGGGLPEKEGIKKEFVGLSVVMKTVKGAEGQANLHARRQLEDSVTGLRKAEKAAAIRIKREEIESLRRALEKPAQDKRPIDNSPSSGGRTRPIDNAVEVQQMAKVGDLSTEPAAPPDTSRQSIRQKQLPWKPVERSTMPSKVSAAEDGDVEATKSNGHAVLANTKDEDDTEPLPLEPTSPHVGPGDDKAQNNHRKVLGSRNRPPPLRPPVVDVSPPLSVRRYEQEDERRGWADGNDEKVTFVGSGPRQARGVITRVGAGVHPATFAGGRQESARPTAIADSHVGGVGRRGLGTDRANVDYGICATSGRPEPAISDDPLHRALLRSIEGEELAEYSKRAYHIYRTNGVIEGGAELDKHRLTRSDQLSSSANQIFERSPQSPPALDVDTSYAQAIIPHGGTEGKIGRDDEAHFNRARRKDCGPVGVGIRETIRPFSPPTVSPRARHPNPETFSSENDGNTSAAAPVSASDDELRVVDLCEAEEPVTQQSSVPASRADGCRSRLRAPRAGRALALASANAHGVTTRRQKEWPRDVCRDVSEGELSRRKSAAVPIRRKEAWTKEGMLERRKIDQSLGKGQVGTEMSRARTSGVVVEIGSDVDEDGVWGRSAAVSKKATPPTEHIARNLGPSRQQNKGNKTRKRGERVLVGVRTRLHHGAGGDCSPDGACTSSEEDGHPSGGEASKGLCPHRPDPVDEIIAIATSDPNNATQQVTIPTTKNVHHAKADDVLGVDKASGGGCFAQPKPIKASAPKTGAAGFHRAETSETKRAESFGEQASMPKERSHDSHAFVWFGPPDTPPGREPDEGIEVKGGAPDLAEAPVTARADQGVGRVCPSQQRSKARLILQMEVRRQRDIIEQAFQAREEEGRIRRARIGAEVFKRMQDLRLRRTVNAHNAKLVGTDPCHVEQLSIGRPDEGQTDNPHAPRSQRVNMSPSQRGKAAEERSPRDGDGGFAPTVKAVHPQHLVLDLAEREKAVASRPKPSTQRQDAPCVVAVADNPWLQVVRMQKTEHGSGISTKREPTRPPISFNVEANLSRGGAGGLDGAEDVEREKARRQERFEALRSRKMAEELERRRGQKERQIAAREEQRRQSATAAVAATAAAAAVAVTVTSEKARGSQDGKSDVRLRHLLHDDPPGAKMFSRDSGHTPRFEPAPSSSVPKNDNHYARPGVSAHGDSSNGSGGGGGARPPAVPAGRLASPVIRGFSRRSNRKLVRNAINFLCLAGGHLEDEKARALEALDSHPASNFVVLLAHTKLLSFKGLYACSGEEDIIAVRVFGLGPSQIDASMASGFYKYNSAAREFREVHSKTLGKTTDAMSMEPTRRKRTKGLATQ